MCVRDSAAKLKLGAGVAKGVSMPCHENLFVF